MWENVRQKREEKRKKKESCALLDIYAKSGINEM